MKNFKVTMNDSEIEVSRLLFSGGEVHVKTKNQLLYIPATCKITAHLRSSDDVMTLLMLNDALRREFSPRFITLEIPYLPYARQDRVCVDGEALSVKVMCDLINGMKFNRVIVWDCHSDVGVALLDNCENVSQIDIIGNSPELVDLIKHPDTVLVSPDAGANKKTLALAKAFGNCDVVRADKSRDVATGRITGTEVYGDVTDKICVIVDDLVDAGFTFTQLATELKRKGAFYVILYVTHGIFSKGIQVLIDSGVDEVYTASSWAGEDGRVKIINV